MRRSAGKNACSAGSMSATSPSRLGAPGRVRIAPPGAMSGGVLDEGGVRMPRVGGQPRQREPARDERLAVALVLREGLLEVGYAEVHGRQPVGEVLRGAAHDGAAEHAKKLSGLAPRPGGLAPAAASATIPRSARAEDELTPSRDRRRRTLRLRSPRPRSPGPRAGGDPRPSRASPPVEQPVFLDGKPFPPVHSPSFRLADAKRTFFVAPGAGTGEGTESSPWHDLAGRAPPARSRRPVARASGRVRRHRDRRVLRRRERDSADPARVRREGDARAARGIAGVHRRPLALVHRGRGREARPVPGAGNPLPGTRRARPAGSRARGSPAEPGPGSASKRKPPASRSRRATVSKTHLERTGEQLVRHRDRGRGARGDRRGRPVREQSLGLDPRARSGGEPRRRAGRADPREHDSGRRRDRDLDRVGRRRHDREQHAVRRVGRRFDAWSRARAGRAGVGAQQSRVRILGRDRGRPRRAGRRARPPRLGRLGRAELSRRRSRRNRVRRGGGQRDPDPQQPLGGIRERCAPLRSAAADGARRRGEQPVPAGART